MSERINHQPEILAAIDNLYRLFALFESYAGDLAFQGVIANAITNIILKTDLESEELVVIPPAKTHRVFRERPRLAPYDPASTPVTQPDTRRITRGETGFYLCSLSEGRLLKSIEDTGVMLVNDFLLVKMVGKISAIALQNTEGFLAGHWYAPRTRQMRQQIRETFDIGVTRMTIPDDVWDYMRPANVDNLFQSRVNLNNPALLTAFSTTEELVEFIRNAVDKLPKQLSQFIAGIPRNEYRNRHLEGK